MSRVETQKAPRNKAQENRTCLVVVTYHTSTTLSLLLPAQGSRRKDSDEMVEGGFYPDLMRRRGVWSKEEGRTQSIEFR